MALGPLMVGVGGTQLSDDELERLAHPGVGGVLLLGRNYQNPEQLRHLVAAIHTIRQPPLLVAVDQEGGRVQRLRDGFTRLPPLRAFGHWHDVDAAAALDAVFWCGWLMAAELRRVGVDFSFAPVLDVDYGLSEVIGDRGFHNAPDVVARLGSAWHRGVAAAGMATVGKHFPGHGGCSADSHVAYVHDERHVEELARHDLVPFRDLIDVGLTGMMPAHVVFPSIASEAVGFSRWWLADYLRGELGFSGPVISDDLGMQAAFTAGDLHARVTACLNAGCDMAILANESTGVDDLLANLSVWDAVSAQRRECLRPSQRGLVNDPTSEATNREARAWALRAGHYAP